MSVCRSISRASSLPSYFTAVIKALLEHNVLSTALTLISLVLLCFGCYQNSLVNEFTFDDLSAIVNNPNVKFQSEGTDYFSANAMFWKNDIWGKDMRALDSHRSYRPLLIIIFKLIAQQSRGLDPRSFRTISILFHCTSTISVYALSSMVFRNSSLAFGTALLFASHPVHVESVAAVVNMAEATSLTLSIITFCIFYKSSTMIMSGNNRGCLLTVYASQSFLGQMLRYVLFFIFLALSVLCKETGITVCGLIVASSGISLLTAIKSFLLSRGYQTNRASIEGRINGVLEVTVLWGKTNILWLLAALCGMFFYSLLRVNLLLPKKSEYYIPFKTITSVFDASVWMEVTVRVSKSYLGDSKFIRKAENSYAFLVGREKLLSLMYLHYRYFYQLILPYSLCAEYSFDCIPKVTSLDDPRFFLSLGLYIFLITVFFILLWRSFVPSMEEGAKCLDDINMNPGGDIDRREEENAEKDLSIKYRNEDKNKNRYNNNSNDNNNKNNNNKDNNDDNNNNNPNNSSNNNEGSDLAASRPWIIEPEHYLLSLIWMIVPFIPASGTN
jgi:Domain of unknown function (DUF1736)